MREISFSLTTPTWARACSALLVPWTSKSWVLVGNELMTKQCGYWGIEVGLGGLLETGLAGFLAVRATGQGCQQRQRHDLPVHGDTSLSDKGKRVVRD
ncbi:hypothetical protein PPS11_40875 [Pseudomonas putida S11]|nr:hypothetical protein PPS11_40875 [Pseudomonas putida S11]